MHGGALFRGYAPVGRASTGVSRGQYEARGAAAGKRGKNPKPCFMCGGTERVPVLVAQRYLEAGVREDDDPATVRSSHGFNNSYDRRVRPSLVRMLGSG